MSQSFNRVGIILCFALLISSIASTTMVRPPQRRNEFNNAEDAVKYLKELDDFYSNAARPRLARSKLDLMQMEAFELASAIQVLRLKIIDWIYSKHSRPRFGKRTSLLQYLKDWAQEADMEDWQRKLQSQR